MNAHSELAYVALFADWPGRGVATASPRVARALGADFSPYEGGRRLRAIGHGQAASLLENQGLLEGAARLIGARAGEGWEPVLPNAHPPGLRLCPGGAAPPLLWAYGYSLAFQRPAVGIVGSRNLAPNEARFAADAGEVCAKIGMPVFSGGAAGADSFGAIGAARAGGAAAHFLPGGSGSPFGPVSLLTTNPDAPPFDRIEALTRNKWIYASSEATIVVASRFGEGGSWVGAIAAMRGRLGRIIAYAPSRPSAGNEALIKLGAEPVSCAAALRDVLSRSLQPKLAV
ncbi:MAG: DNA-protecting protein DprA [Armatimonadota bacterium]|nr:DNA-protecting protein DprA [Armatimonadota bacterium]